MYLKPTVQAVVLERKSSVAFMSSLESRNVQPPDADLIQGEPLFHASHRLEKPKPRNRSRAFCYHGFGTHQYHKLPFRR